MIFLKFLIFNILLLASQVYCDQLKLSCKEKDLDTSLKLSCIDKNSDTSVSGFDARFYLSTGKNRTNRQIRSKGDKLKRFLDKQGFDNNVGTVVLIHGFLNDHSTSWVAELQGNLTRKQKLNVIQLDWSDAFFNKHIDIIDYFNSDDDSDEDDAGDYSIIPEELNPLDYKSAALRTELAADKLGRLLIKIANTRPNPKQFLANLHLIGHSLGAHVAGQTGRFLCRNAKVQVKRITGLDPAYPCFKETKNPTLKLDVNDAKFVDVIHTNSMPKSNPNFGTYGALGHMDFYPHRGYNQPKCDLNRQGKSLESLKELLKAIVVETLSFFTKTILNVDAANIALNYLNNRIPGSDERFDIICDHGEAPNYFTQSLSRDIYAVPTTTPIKEDMIRNLTGQLRRCATTKNCVKMGYHAIDSANKPGKYYADTTI